MMTVTELLHSIACCERMVNKLKTERVQDWTAIHWWLDRIEELEHILRQVVQA